MTPNTESDLAELVAGAAGPLCIRGGGTRPLGRQVEGDVLNTTGLSGVSLYEPGALTLVAQAGTPLAEIEDLLAAEGQRLAFEPMDHRGLLKTAGVPTIGGVVAANVSGPRRIQVGACRDHVLGVRFVDGQGHVIKNGGRVMKNVTGYDLVKLMTGSFGTLGVLTEVSLKVLPRPEVAATLTLGGLDIARAVQAMSRALSSPYDVTGAAHGNGLTSLRLEGFAGSVAYRADQLRRALTEFGDTDLITDAEAGARHWTDIRDVTALQARSGDVWRFSVKPGDASEITARLDPDDVIYDWGGGLIWALMPAGCDARARVGNFSGHATLVRSDSDLPRFQPEPAPLAELATSLRRRFDPRGILNPGLMT